jgi:hypothetical protein
MAAQSTYTLLQTYTFPNSTTTGMTFANIPQTYTDLVMVGNFSYTGSAVLAGDVPNETSTSESYTYLYGSGSTITSGRGASNSYFILVPTTVTTSTTNFQTVKVNWFNYSNTTTFKTWISQWANDQNGSGDTGILIGKNASTTAITQISLSTANGSVFIRQGSVFSLYGILAA